MLIVFLNNYIVGCGKTTIAKTIAAYLRSKGKIVLICASTGLAAQNYPNDASTAHQLFNIPVVEMEMRDVADDPIECNLDWMRERVELLLACDVVIWDEFPSSERRCFECVCENTHLKQLRGKVFIGLGKNDCFIYILIYTVNVYYLLYIIGDVKQILPVGKDRRAVLDLSIFSSRYWNEFIKLGLTVNMRLQNPRLTEIQRLEQSNFAKLIEDVGYNRLGGIVH